MERDRKMERETEGEMAGEKGMEGGRKEKGTNKKRIRQDYRDRVKIREEGEDRGNTDEW